VRRPGESLGLAKNLAIPANRLPLARNREAMDDDALIAAVSSGDDTALRELFSRHAPWLAARLRAVLLPPTSGKLRLLGRDPGSYGPRREIRRRLGYLPQSLGYYPGFTVADFVEYFALLKDMPPGQVPRAVAAAVEQVGLGDRARAKLRTLSGGMLRRAGIAQAIVNGPELLLLDEPTAGLDPEQRVAFRALLRDLGQRSTVMVRTHLVEDVGAACTEVALMDAGKIVFHGTPAS
jgi:ABC-2 type transport system ATP-binding protein